MKQKPPANQQPVRPPVLLVADLDDGGPRFVAAVVAAALDIVRREQLQLQLQQPQESEQTKKAA